MDLMKALTSQYMKKELPEMNVGDTVRVHVKIKEGSRERIQIFEGTIIAKNMAALRNPSPFAAFPTVSAARRFSRFTRPTWSTWRPFVTAKSAERSSTTCVTVSARLPRSRKRFNANRKETPFGVSFLYGIRSPYKPYP